MTNKDLKWFQDKLRNATAERDAFENAWNRATKSKTKGWMILSLVLMTLCLFLGSMVYFLVETPSETKEVYITSFPPKKQKDSDYFAKKYDTCQDESTQLFKKLHEANEKIKKLEGLQ